jgi:PAS domain S-box-containing protein
MTDELEAARLRALDAYRVLGTAPEESFDRLTALAADLFDAPIALVSLVDAERQWFKSRHGVDAESTPRSMAFCAHAIELGANAAMVVEDATLDPRFQANPLVTGDPNIRFYAGATLTGTDGFNLGTLCVIDTKPRPAPSEDDLRRLKTLAGVVVGELELRRLRAIERERARFERLANAVAGVGYWRLDVATRRITWSDQMFFTYGLVPGAEPPLDAAMAMAHPEDRAAADGRVARALETGQGWTDGLTRIIRPDGETRYVEGRGICEHDETGAVTAVVGTMVDVTERKRAELAVAEADAERKVNIELFENAFDYAAIGMALVGLDGHFLKVNPAFCDLVGYGPSEMLALDFQTITHPDDLETDLDYLAQLTAGQISSYQMEKRYIRADRSVVSVSLSVSMVAEADGKPRHFVAQVQDLTARKAAEAARVESEQRFRRLAVNAPDMITESTLDGVLTYVSPASLAVTGFAPEELVGRPSSSIMHPEDAAKVLEMCRAVFASKGKLAAWPVEFRAKHKDGRDLWMECKPTLNVDPVSGRFIGLNDVVRDITTRKALEAELRQARAEAEAGAAVKGEFLANMSHELRTPLTSIVGFTRLAAEQADLQGLTRNYVERVGEASRALLCTVNDILDFSQLEAGQVSFQPEPTSLSQLSRATLELFMPQAGAKDLDLALDSEAETSELALMLDPDRIRQILLNLVGNAVKFTDAGGVTLRTRYDQKAARLSVEVIDTGPGIPPEKQALLFKRFSQVDGSLTRSHGGTGLGLAICKGLVEAMGGEIGAESRVGGGSRFWFSIPAPKGVLPSASAGGAGAEQPTFSGIRVLVADDHPANRELARLILAGVGAEVSEAADGVEAAEMASTWPYDVILMDLRMPNLDGQGALRKIRGEPGPNDATPILAFTADADAANAESLAAMGFQDVVGKPLEPVALIVAVARATAFHDAAYDEDKIDVA